VVDALRFALEALSLRVTADETLAVFDSPLESIGVFAVIDSSKRIFRP
jgi:hypothetical protein